MVVDLQQRHVKEIGVGGPAAARGACSEGGRDDDDRDARRPGAPHRARMLADPARRRLLSGERRQELHRAALGPRPDTPGPAAFDEPDMAAAGRELGANPRRQVGETRQRVGRNDRIVEGVDEQGRPADARQVGSAGRLAPVVALVCEPIERRRDQTIVAGERPRAAHLVHVYHTRQLPIAGGLVDHLGPHRPQEVRRVDPAAWAAVEHARARREIERGRDRHGADDLRGCVGAALAQPFQQDVAAERHADDREAQAALAAGQHRDHLVEVVGVAGVIEREPPVQLPAARAEVEGDGPPAAGGGLAHEPDGVVRLRRALQSMEDENERRTGRRPVGPVEIDEVTVAGGDPLPPRLDTVAAEERTPDGLRVRVPAPPRGPERGLYAWPWRSSLTISGTISRARRSSSASVRLAIGCAIIRNLYVGTPHCSAMARAVFSKTSVTIDAEGTAFFSSTIPSSTLPDEQDPQSPTPATMASNPLRSSTMISSCAGTDALCFLNMRVSATPYSALRIAPILSSSRSELNFVLSIRPTRLPSSDAGRSTYAMPCVVTSAVGSRSSIIA